jgi:hypothetical protein
MFRSAACVSVWQRFAAELVDEISHQPIQHHFWEGRQVGGCGGLLLQNALALTIVGKAMP